MTGQISLTSTASCTGLRAVAEHTGEAVGERELARRVGHLTVLIQAMAAHLVAAHWTSADLDLLASGKSLDGRALPSKGWMALRRLGWAAAAPDGVAVCDRLRRCAEEEAARTLRLALHRRRILAALVATWPEQPGKRSQVEWTALRAVLPDGVSPVEIRNRTRQIRAWAEAHGVALPGDLVEVEDPPQVAAQALLAAADRQLTTLERTGEQSAVLRVQLPLVAAPASRRDWAWHALPFTLPPIIAAEAVLCAPTLRSAAHRVRLDLPHRSPITHPSPAGHTTGLGLDWGVNTLLTGALARLTDTSAGPRVLSDGRRLRYDASAVSAKLHRLRQVREHVAARRDHYEALLAGLAAPQPLWAELQSKHAVLVTEHARICARLRQLNRALAWSAARWAVDQARALGASVIYLEDLATLEARGKRSGNARLAGQVRGLVAEAIAHLAAREGIAVVAVPARGTSKYCPRCGSGTQPLKHVAAPDRMRESGWKWAACTSCGLSCDRDHAAAERIAARGLLSQTRVRTDRHTGRRTVTIAVEGNVARARRRTPRPTPPRAVVGRPAVRADRAKTGPTPKRPAAASPGVSRRVPDRRAVPAPPSGGQCPAGQAPQNHPHPGARSGPAHGFPNPQHDRTGFHRVRASPVLALGDFGAGADRPRHARNVRFIQTHSGNQRR
ncbi:zinc ribbon domain-containing protein [Planomonospora venezuelensis]|uniref:Cas12f1-like TNB domain-containing protein n=1 Tax=Planomonospora venezuelensis TaxID=1999 RepID=A0A841D3S6_PLAVE|nr:zinc ribbon domain-containing protein [Planomonospora venezuelensis]MBB5964901.1 hypothetical protein [Planomonospora venezuelensis]GIM99489.1 hypothetical protein Pve01_11480 [Planomonospora venezuelensis]